MQIILHNQAFNVSFRFAPENHNKVAFATQQLSLGENIILRASEDWKIFVPSKCVAITSQGEIMEYGNPQLMQTDLGISLMLYDNVEKVDLKLIDDKLKRLK